VITSPGLVGVLPELLFLIDGPFEKISSENQEKLHEKSLIIPLDRSDLSFHNPTPK
jgi:hypothetical protein